MGLNRYLLEQARDVVRATKSAFVPAGGPQPDPAAGGGAPPGGAPAPGGAPPGGAPAPVDPAMADPAAGGAPPMDPSAMGGVGGDIRSIIRQEIQAAMAQNGGPGGAQAAVKKKVQPEQLAEYMYRHEKLLTSLYEALGMPLPYDILDRPPELDPTNQAGATPGQPGVQPAPGGAGPGAGAGPQNMTGIPPIQPIAQGAGGGGGEKSGSVLERAEALRLLLAQLRC